MPLEAVVGIAFNLILCRLKWDADRFACKLQDCLGTRGDRLKTCTCYIESCFVFVIIDSIFVVHLLGVSLVTLR